MNHWKKTINTLLLSSFILNSACTSYYSPNSAYDEQSSDFATAAPSPYPEEPEAYYDDLRNLHAGVLPDPSATENEQVLIGVLAREVKANFPLKIGVIQYQKSTPNLDSEDRNYYFQEFTKKLKENDLISEVINISSGLTSNQPEIDELRNLGARFQVDVLLIINEKYNSTKQNFENTLSPVDILSGNRYWEADVEIEAYALEVLNGVFIFSERVFNVNEEKYNSNYIYKNRSEAIINEAAKESWENLSTAISIKLEEFNENN